MRRSIFFILIAAMAFLVCLQATAASDRPSVSGQSAAIVVTGNEFALLPLALQTKTPSNQLKSATTAYLFTFLLGFGSGQFYLGEHTAWKFLLADTLCFAGFGLGGVILGAASQAPALTGIIPGLFGLAVLGVSGITYIIVRVTEILNVVHTVRIMKENKTIADLEVTPVLSPTAAGVSVALHF